MLMTCLACMCSPHRPLRCQVAIGAAAERLATNRDVEQVGEIG